MDAFVSQLYKILPNRVREQESMAKHTNFHIGGPADVFVEVVTEEELVQTVSLANEHAVPYVVLGGGSNMLVADQGVRGLVIKVAIRTFSLEQNCIQAGAGLPMIFVARKAADAGLTGLEWAITLPGTVGGAVRGNAGCFGGETKDVVDHVRVFVDGVVLERDRVALQYAYRESSIKHSTDIVTSATFVLAPGDRFVTQERMNTFLTQRKNTQPTDAGSAGCMFKNYEIASDEDLQRIGKRVDLPPEVSQRRQVSAGWLIDQLDLKGYSIGAAQVSKKHGNFLVNAGGATADEVVQLIAFIKTRVRDVFGIDLQEEVQYIGF